MIPDNYPPLSITMRCQQVNEQVVNQILEENHQHRNTEHDSLQEFLVFHQVGICRYQRLIHCPNQAAVQDQQDASDNTN